MTRLAVSTPVSDDLTDSLALSRETAGERDTAFEVATVAADTLRAGIRIAGELTKPACAVLVCVLRAHLRAGRHYLRVDIADAPVIDAEVIDSLVQLHRQVTAVGGMLVFENAGPRVIDAVRHSTLFVRAAY